MTELYRECARGTFVQWRGEPLGRAKVKYPPNIGELWSAEELAAIRLYRPEPALEVPAGKTILATSVKRVDGVVRYVYTLGDRPVHSAADYAAAVQGHLDNRARTRDYADIFAAISYASSTIHTWRQDAVAFAAWRDAVWLYVYGVQDAVTAGTRSQPTIAELIAELPALDLPG